MNPDLQIAIASGAPVTTIYLTSGEADAENPKLLASYASQREAGARAAYAMMAGVADEWTSLPISFDTTHIVELVTLKAKPTIQLVFVELPEDADHLATGGKHTLIRLIIDPILVATTVRPEHATVEADSRYTSADVVALLVQLFEKFQPTVLRALDQAPDVRYVADPQWQSFHDHPDHVVSARLVDRAAHAYCAAHRTAQLMVLNYRAYNLAEVAANLDPAQHDAKVAVFAKYIEHDSKASMKSPYVEYAQSQYYRWPRGGSWATRGSNGIWVFAVKSGSLVAWHQNGTFWDGPSKIGKATNLAPYVSATTDKTGRIHVFVREIDNNHSILTIAQQKTKQTWPVDFTNLGSPNPPAPDLSHTQVGLPLAATTNGGLVVAFVRNGGGGLSSNVSAGTAWNDLGGFELQDGMATITTPDQKLWVFANTRFKLLRWSQSSPDQPLVVDQALPISNPIGAPGVTALGAGIAIAFRSLQGAVSVLMPSSDQAIAIPGFCGPGGLAAATLGTGDSARVIVIARDNAAGVQVAIQTSPAAFGDWVGLGGQLVDYPMAMSDAGKVMLFGLDFTGRLVVNEHDGANAFGGWHQFG